MTDPISERFTVGDREIAVLRREGDGPCVVWLGGFRSDMTATKASAIDAWGAANGRAVLRFDYSGHGASSGRFEDGTIGLWLEDTLAAIERYAGPAPILVGSSMGGWIALLAARLMAAPPSGLVLIAPAVDFTEELMWADFPEPVRGEIMTAGCWMRPSEYGPPYPITRALIEDGRRHLMLGGPIRAGAPVHILQGMDDVDVPWAHTIKVVERLAEDDVVVTLVKGGDHRLSREEDIARLIEAVDGIAARA
ncbi:alpha/beta hydrolase [Hansschlegelia quercus]|uniref:Palmitoyl-protein thioesterase ABHD10, mitochondrial n=1 Tax=Hansschlegelia quercus TaxID=2528245 RepID=A0A4Q9GIA7_9HYPH|nr:alpha/beta hydrolase [Hansschlegelia quercus]TBN53758.1 alpha/beta hydrolase [Hansschlegelia quercus]